MAEMHVAVTGGSGFVGAAVCAALSDLGCTVAVLSRRPCADTGDRRFVAGGLGDVEAIDDLLDGADAVVHAAGLVRSDVREALWTVNVQGTVDLLERSGHVARFVHVSTAGVHGWPGGVVDEASPLAPTNEYEASKAAAERALLEVRPGGSIVLRPTNILGPGHPMVPLSRFLRAVRQGRVWASRQAWSNYVGVDAVAAAVAAAVHSPSPPSTLLINDPRPVVDLAMLAAQLLDVPDRVRLVPSLLARVARRPLTAGETLLPQLHRVRSMVETTRFQTRHTAWLRAAGVTTAVEPTLLAMIDDYRTRGLL